MGTSKLAKCGLYKYSFCTHKHDAVECASCLLVNRHGKMYKYINGVKYKKCPHCGEYKPLSEYHTNSNGHKSWCVSCSNAYSKEYAKAKKQENKPIVRIIEFSNSKDSQSNDTLPRSIYDRCETKNYTIKEFKEWYKKVLDEDKSGKKYIVTKL